MSKKILAIGAVFGFLAVLLGAFGAHVLKDRLAINLLNGYEVAVRYQMYHALAILVLAGLSKFISTKSLNRIGWLFVAGIVVFSGSLYLLVFTGVKTWGAVTPLGGLIFLAGWGYLATNLISAKR